MMSCPNRWLLLKNEGILQTRINQRGGTPHENEFWVLSNSEMQTVRSSQLVQKVDEKIYFLVPFWVMVLKLSKKVLFLLFCSDLSKKSKSVKAIYLYASESSRYVISENGIIMLWLTVLEMLGFEVCLKNLKPGFC